MRKAIHGDKIIELEFSTFEIRDSEAQALEFRVGPVYKGNEIHRTPGIWITYQPTWLKTPLLGPVLISPMNWTELAGWVGERIAGFDRKDYRR